MEVPKLRVAFPVVSHFDLSGSKNTARLKYFVKWFTGHVSDEYTALNSVIEVYKPLHTFLRHSHNVFHDNVCLVIRPINKNRRLASL